MSVLPVVTRTGLNVSATVYGPGILGPAHLSGPVVVVSSTVIAVSAYG